jgi:hypothetical protein
MNTARYVWCFFAVATVCSAALSNGGCSSVPIDFEDFACDSKPFAPDVHCLKQLDAGADAESDAGESGGAGGTGGSSAKEDPGLDPASVFRPDACQTECVPEAEGPNAAGWSNIPVVVWFGPRSELEAHKCPDGESYEKAVRYDKLVASPAKCEACACLPEGSCADLPETIEIRSGKCGVSNVQTTPFDGPPDWDGSCTSVNAIPVGKLCNGVPCAQSVSTSALPAPTNESCTPTTEKPNATISKHEWLEGVRVCDAKDLPGKCAVTPEHCQNPLKEGWLRCVMQEGRHNECPGNYNDFAPRYVYQDNPIDNRGCSECVCGAPKDGICLGSLRLYSDALCSTELNNNLLSSIKPFCVDLTVPGLALGSKTITNLYYVPGTCAVAGGEPIGTVVPNDNENSGVVTFCCRAPAPSAPPVPG